MKPMKKSMPSKTIQVIQAFRWGRVHWTSAIRVSNGFIARWVLSVALFLVDMARAFLQNNNNNNNSNTKLG
eukprot:m.268121 g.268121  ORF g.268121 m.268121 type:complete len:71 (+) comp73422_c0_seq1:42-254(+)